MRLKELQIYGFKSFPNKTTVKFSDGITAIIGPNGCGKTNILDALRWVLGEQSFSILRCNKNEELIFGGTAKYPPLGYTEVKLVLENNGDIPNLGSEIEVKRKYFRSGESEYYINRNTCRLKDIQDIFLSSRASTKAYSIFDLKQMREIISGGAKKMFEEAANLAKYRERKNETFNKLALTETELLRLNDVIAERERYTRSLKRQARRLEVYERLREEEKKVKLVALKTQYQMAKNEEEQAEVFLKNATAKEEAVLSEISHAEGELEQLRQQLREARTKKENLTKELEEKRDRLQEQEKSTISKREHINYLKQEIERLYKESEKLQEKIEAGKEKTSQLEDEIKAKQSSHDLTQQELERIRSEVRKEETVLFNEQQKHEQEKGKLQLTSEQIISLRQKQIGEVAQSQNLTEAENKLKAEIGNLETRIKTLATSIGQKENRIKEIDDKLAEMKTVVGAKNGEREKFNTESKDLVERKRLKQESIALVKQEIQLFKTTLGQAPKEIVKAKLDEGFLGSIREFLKVKDGYERSVESALYAILDFLVVKNQIELTELKADFRLGFLLASDENFKLTSENSEKPESEAIKGRLNDFVEIKPGSPKLLQKLLNEFFLVDNFSQACELSKKYPKFSFVTADGIALFNQDLIVMESQTQGRLSIEKKLVDKETEKTQLDNELGIFSEKIANLEMKITEINQAIEQTQAQILNLISERSNLQAGLNAEKNSTDELRKEMVWLKNDLSQTQTRLQEREQQIAGITKNLEELVSVEQPSKGAISSLDKAILERQKQIKVKLEEASKVLFNLGKMGEELSIKRAELAYQIKDNETAQSRIEEIDELQKNMQKEVEFLTNEIQATEQQIEGNRAIIKLSHQTIDDLTIDNLAKTEENIETTLREKRNISERDRAELMEKRMRQFEIQKQREAIEHEAREFYETDIATVEVVPDKQVADRLKMISERLTNLGKVNPLAKEEYQSEKAELDKYLVQRQDVLDARNNLQKTISEIEQHAKDQFLNTFRLVRERFRSIFTRLFIEGEADLNLQDEANPLDSEIEIIARPKGKIPKRLEHLSDGEKALLALSLLFAFYAVKPAPFCFFDEVDAPLDDVNVVRFADFLRELAAAGTQGVVITHNRMTIEKADVLLGVTTEEPGVSKVISVRLTDYKSEKEKDEVRF
jgi:chromosome segregation protein